MPRIEELLEVMRRKPKDMRFSEVKRVCDHFFGDHRRNGSHYVYSMPWSGDPRVNIQNRSGRVVGYQIAQVVRAVDRLENGDE